MDKKNDQPIIIWVDPKELIPHEDNERKISLEDFTQLKASIQRLGFIDPMIANSNPDRKNIIIGGHQRHKAALDLALPIIPVIYRNYAIEQETEARLRLNRNTGEYDWQKLRKFDQEYLTSIGFNLTDIQMIYTDNFDAIDDKLSLKANEFTQGHKMLITFSINKEDEKWVKDACEGYDWDIVKILKTLEGKE